ncbi:MAG: YigZ family protein, partial [Tissierellia bacterium]|nr:YigZ family protein [Tissierellia bacterium]
MINKYKTIYSGGYGEIVVKKSKFIATISTADTEEKAISFIDEMKKKYYDARHNCSAYIISIPNEVTRFNDDGEPSRTAGLPMLNVLQGENLHNVVAVVTRYFGGTLLGTGGLIRAYTDAVKEGLENCTIIEKQKGMKFSIEMDYTTLGKVQYLLSEEQIP